MSCPTCGQQIVNIELEQTRQQLAAERKAKQTAEGKLMELIDLKIAVDEQLATERERAVGEAERANKMQELCVQYLAERTAAEAERDLWERRDERTAEALADAIGTTIVADMIEDALAGYVKTLAAERDRLREQLRLATEALDCYANSANWTAPIDMEHIAASIRESEFAVDSDIGARARAALAAIKETAVGEE